MPSDRNSWAWIVRQLLQHRRTVVIGVFLIGALLSVGVLLGDWRRMRLEVEEAFRSDASEEFGTLREEIQEAVNSAASVADFFQTVGSVDRRKFHEFVVPHLTRAPGLLALVWAPRIPDGSRRRFEAECRLAWGTTLGIFERDGREGTRAAGQRAEYFPVYFRETLVGPDSSQIAGYDLGGAPPHLEALQRARDTGLPAMTASLPLIDGGDGVLFYWPIYQRGAPRATVEERRKGLQGIVGAVFRIDELVESSLKELNARGIDISLFDEGASAADRLLYSRPSRSKKPRRSWFGQRLMEDHVRSGLQWTSSLDLGGRRWTASITPSAEYVTARVSPQMWANIFLGLLATGLVGGYLLVLMRRTDEVERLVASRTQELRQAHHRLLEEVGERTRAEEVARRLTQQALSVQEEERQRLSRELHDEAGQSLTGLVLHLQLLDAELPEDQTSLRRRLREAGALARGAAERIRLLARDLRPPGLDTLGLNASLRGLCHEIARRTGVSIGYTGSEVVRLPDTITICLYRVLQEALTNVVRHAGASQVQVVLQDDAETVILTVEDDGLGFDTGGVIPRRSSFQGIGLLGMQERLELVGGWLEITSRPGQGTRLTARIPATVVGAESASRVHV